MDAMDPRQVARFGHRSALLLLVGLLLSGPATVAGVSLRHPQPVVWRGAEAYVRAFHPLQLATYAFGFLILLGAVGLFSSLLVLAPRDGRLPGVVALVFVAMFGSVIGVNYMFQLAVLRPAVAAGQAGAVEFLAFNNPDSATMALEMLGYGFLGLATAAAAPLFPGPGRARRIRWLAVANGVVSVAGTALQAAGALAGLAGLAAYLVWNLLFLWLVVEYLLHLRAAARARSGMP
jgi:hypothetical protein